MIKIPHQMADYLCPVNGLCGIYEWKTGARIPEELLFFARPGFQMISQKRAVPPKMVFWGQGSIGKDQFNFWKDLVGYHIIAGEGKSYKSTVANIKALVEQKVPVVLFGLDMYHLPYHEHFYHMKHIPGHVVLMVGYDDRNVYVHDNSRPEVEMIPWGDLQQAWAADYIGISKKNAYFGIDMQNPNRDISSIIQEGLKRNAELYLNSPVNFIGQKGMERMMKELPDWNTMYDAETMKQICLHLIEFSGSTLPEIPEELSGIHSAVPNTHQGGRDKLAAALLKYQDTIGTVQWSIAADAFQKSGLIIEAFIGECIRDVLNTAFSAPQKYIPLLKEIQKTESSAFRALEIVKIPQRKKGMEQVL